MPKLAATLATQFGRGDRDTQLSLSRAFGMLGQEAAAAILQSTTSPDENVRAHAIATEHLLERPDEGFDAAIAEARKVVVLRDAPLSLD